MAKRGLVVPLDLHRVHHSNRENDKLLTQESPYVKNMFDRFDKRELGYLDRTALGWLLMDLNNGEPVTDDELQYVLYTADSSDAQINGVVNRWELKPAIEAWQRHSEHRSKIDRVFAAFDVNRSGALEQDEFTHLLRSLTPTQAIDDRVVREILKQADEVDGNINGVINRTEVVAAIDLWYRYIDSQKRSRCVLL